MNVLKRFWKDQAGATAIEYGLITALIALAIVLAVDQAGLSMRDGVYTDIQDIVH